MSVQRLDGFLRRQVGIDYAAARNMHVASDAAINIPVRPSRYNYREENGNIKKITLFDSSAMVETFKKIKGKYKKISIELFGENTRLSSNIKQS